MNKTKVAAAVLTALLAGGALAQSPTAPAPTVGSEVQRNINQQSRIENGLQSGALTTREASQLEKGESRINRMESNALRNGTLSPAEAQRINNAQNAESRDIYRDTHNGRVGDPASASSQRMQADVQRNINQQSRIESGIQSGSLTNREAGRLEHGQANVERREYRAGRDGSVNRGEEARIARAENRQSGAIYREKHDGAHAHR